MLIITFLLFTRWQEFAHYRSFPHRGRSAPKNFVGMASLFSLLYGSQASASSPLVFHGSMHQLHNVQNTPSCVCSLGNMLQHLYESLQSTHELCSAWSFEEWKETSSSVLELLAIIITGAMMWHDDGTNTHSFKTAQPKARCLPSPIKPKQTIQYFWVGCPDWMFAIGYQFISTL